MAFIATALLGATDRRELSTTLGGRIYTSKVLIAAPIDGNDVDGAPPIQPCWALSASCRSASVKALPQDTAVPHRQNLLVILHDILGVIWP